jgi:hypothetical protein
MKRKGLREYPKKILDLMSQKSKVLSQAETLSLMGMTETAKPLWAAAAGLEETIAPLLEALGHAGEAAVHRASAATCYEKCEDWSRATNLYRAALAGPLSTASRREVETLLAKVLDELDVGSRKTA